MTIASAYMSLVREGSHLLSDKSSGAVQLIDALVSNKASKVIDARPYSDKRARGGLSLLMSILDYKHDQHRGYFKSHAMTRLTPLRFPWVTLAWCR